MKLLETLPARQRPAPDAVLRTLLGAAGGGARVELHRQELLERSGLSWTTWRRGVDALVALGGDVLVVTAGAKDGAAAVYALGPRALEAGREAPAARGTEPGGPPDGPPAAYPASRARNPLKSTRNEKAAASSPPVAHPATAHHDARLTTEELDAIGAATARHLVALLSAALTPGAAAVPHRDVKPANVPPRAATPVPSGDALSAARACVEPLLRPGDPAGLLEAAAKHLAGEWTAGRVKRSMGALAPSIVERMRVNPGDVASPAVPTPLEAARQRAADDWAKERAAREAARRERGDGPSPLDLKLMALAEAKALPPDVARRTG